MKFYASLTKATQALGGTHFTENETLVCGGHGRRWPNHIQTATVHGAPQGDIKMRKVDCYGWRVSE